MRIVLLCVLSCLPGIGLSQAYKVTGHVTDGNDSTRLGGARIQLYGKTDTANYRTDTSGYYELKGLSSGGYTLVINAYGYDQYKARIDIAGEDVTDRTVYLQSSIRILNEVKIVEKLLAVVQKDDTTEFNSGAYKVNPDADADELIRRMPSISISNKQVTAQGEQVVKILVDGKPFFGSDPYTALKNLPADMIAKVQVYNEKSDQEQFTGFSEGATSKTINIITKQDKKKGTFGKLYAGGGGDLPNNISTSSGLNKYGTGASVNEFGGDRRATVTLQSNNINEQNFSEQSPGSVSTGSGGVSKTNAGGVNLSDKWGKKADVTASYFFAATNNSITQQSRKTYITSVDSGQVYNETDPSSSTGKRHTASLRFNYVFDTMNSLLLQSGATFSSTTGAYQRQGNTVDGLVPVNNTQADNDSKLKSDNFNGSLLFRHKFYKRGRTLSVSTSAVNSYSDGVTENNARNIYYLSPALSDTLQQRGAQHQYSWSLNGNATYTEPVGESGSLKLEYNVSLQPGMSRKLTNDYDPLTGSYSRPDTQYSNSFSSDNVSQKAGGSYMLRKGEFEFSVGANYQNTMLANKQTLPLNSDLSHTFQNVLPVAMMKYKLSKVRNLQINYNTSVSPPSLNQLQNVVNNTDPLHLYVGNPALKQPYQHTISLRYNSSNSERKSNFSANIAGRYTQDPIVSNTIIATRDTLVTAQRILLATGSQLSMPLNARGSSGVSANMNYGTFLNFIKCNLNVGVNGGSAFVPSIINNQLNHQRNDNAGFSVSLNSSINERTDFSLSSSASMTHTSNSLNSSLDNSYFNDVSSATINLILWKGIVFYTGLNYSVNAGLSAGYNKDYLLCNMSIGKKIFRKHQGDIRLTVFDMLNQNNNIRHTITDTYTQDSYSNALQRYYMLVFTYKIREFRK